MSNAGWLLAEQIGVNLIGLAVTVLVARSLGVADFGLYAYVISIAALAGMLGMMGLDGLLTRELVQHPEVEAETLGTVAMLRLAGYGLGAALILLFGLSQAQHSPQERMLFVMAAGAIVLNALVPIMATWFRARELSRPAALAALTAAGFGGGAKIALASAGIAALGVAHVGAASLALILILYGYRSHNGPALQLWRFKPERARNLLNESMVLFIGSVLAMAYMNMDLLMVRHLAGPEAAGSYAVPSRLVQAAHVVPAAISVALFPRQISAHAASDGSFEAQMRLGFSVVALIAYSLILAAAVAGGPVVAIVFGPDWDSAGPLLLVLSLTLPLAFMRFIVTRWIILERQGYYLVCSEGLGALVNISLNFVLIPSMGVIGAAIATLIAYCVAGPVSLMVWPRGRPIGKMLLLSLLDPVSQVWRWQHAKM